MPMLIARNALISYQLDTGNSGAGTFQDGSTPAFSALSGSPSQGIAMQCVARSYSREVTFGTSETGAICDKFQKTFVTRGSGTIEIEKVIETGGPTFDGKEGFYIRVIYFPESTSTAIIDVGVITKCSQRLDIDGIQTESISIDISVLGSATT